MAELFTLPFTPALDSDGNPLSGAKLRFDLTGTTTLATVYADAELTTPLTNPVVADSAGRFVPIYLSPSVTYRARLYTAGDVLIGDVDPYNGAQGQNALYDVDFGVKADGTTDDSAATNDFLAALTARGGVGYMKPGPRLFASQVTWDRSFPTVTSAAMVIADGVVVRTTHNGTAFRINGSPGEFLWTELRGLTVDEQTNATSKGGIEQVNTACVVLRNCHNRSNGDVMTSSYNPYWIRQADPLDFDTGSYWTWHVNCAVRRTGTAFLNNAVVLQGSANATTIQGGVYAGVSDGVKFQNEPGGTPYLANGCTVLDSAFEGITGNAVRVSGNVGQQTALGLRIIGGRFETIGGAVLSLEGATANTPRCPSVFMPSIDNTVGAIVNNPNNLNVDITFVDTDRTTQSIEQTGGGKIIRSQFAVNDVLDLQTANINSGLRISNISGSGIYGWLRAISGGLELAGNAAASFFLKLSAVSGISGTATRANNLRGVLTFAAETSKTVTFSIAETDANYFLTFGQTASSTSPPWVSSQLAGSFTVTFSAPFTGSVYWHLIR